MISFSFIFPRMNLAKIKNSQNAAPIPMIPTRRGIQKPSWCKWVRLTQTDIRAMNRRKAAIKPQKNRRNHRLSCLNGNGSSWIIFHFFQFPIEKTYLIPYLPICFYFMFDDLCCIKYGGMVPIYGLSDVLDDHIRVLSAEINVNVSRIGMDLLPRFWTHQ